MTSCQRCGKLIASGTAERLCFQCRQEQRRVERPAPEPPRAALDEPAPELVIGTEPELCVRCGRHPTITDSEFCLGCQLELVATLGEAAGEVFRTPPAPAPPVASTVSLMRDLEEKRERTATSHIRVVGAVRVK